jgi:hypothetical protein
MTRVTFSHPGPVGRSQRVHNSSLKTTTPFHWPLDVKAGQRFGLARQLTHLLHEHARDNADQPPRNEEPCTPQPCLSHIEPGLQYLLALSVASARSGPPGRMEGRTCACMPCHRYLYLLTAASAAARPCNARLGPPGQHLRMYCVLVGLPNHAADPPPR